MSSLFIDELRTVNKKPTAKNVTAWPAISSATISRGSFFPTRAITEGLNLTQIKEPIKAKTTITIDKNIADVPNWHIKAKIIVGGSDPHVPGATGSRPRPKQDVSNLFIIAKG